MHPLKSLLPQARPREKLFEYGPAQLTEVELWCCVLGSGSKTAPVEKMAQALARSQSGSRPDMSTYGQAQRARVEAVWELQRRYEATSSALEIHSPKDVALVCRDIATAKKEWVVGLYCSVSGCILKKETVALGSLNMAAVRPADLFFPLRSLPVYSLILVHNHPSGTLEPSPEDLVFTERMRAACSLLGIILHDHVIVGKNGYVSLRERGDLP